VTTDETSRLQYAAERISDIEARLAELAPARAPTAPFAEQLARVGQRQTATGAAELKPIVRHAGAAWGVDPGLIDAVIRAESGYNPVAVSPSGAVGLMQLMPGTAEALGVSNALDPVENVFAGARYLRAQLDTFGDVALALAAYNAGPAAVRRYGGIPPYPETRAYVQRVLDYWQKARDPR
jgi:soluble lytic murein transglycosylase-like protein